VDVGAIIRQAGEEDVIIKKNGETTLDAIVRTANAQSTNPVTTDNASSTREAVVEIVGMIDARIKHYTIKKKTPNYDPKRIIYASNELVDLAKEIDEWWTKRIESQNASADTFVTSTPAPVSVKSTDANAAASTPSATNEPRSSNAPAVIDRATSTEADVQAAIRDAVVSGRGLTIAENGITRMQIAARRPVQDYDDPRSNEAPADVHPPLTNYGRNGRWNQEISDLRKEVERLRNVIRTGGAMYRAERATMGIAGGHDWKVVQPDGYIVAEGTRQFCEGAMFALKAYTTSDAYSVEQNDACTAKAEVK